MTSRPIMIRIGILAVLAALIGGVVFATGAMAKPETIEFKRAALRVEINATDGDAGLQIDLDHEPWQSLKLSAPDGRTLLDVRNRDVLKGYGLTELFSESSEPPFEEFPLSEFKQLFPEGDYVFEGRQTDGTRMRSIFTLTHDFPEGPVITSPDADATLGADELVVAWDPVTEPAEIEIVRYQVLVVYEETEGFEFSAFVPADVTSMAIPAEFLTQPGAYKAEVLAIEQSGNQTLSEVDFEIE
jgi:hypothetical protein